MPTFVLNSNVPSTTEAGLDIMSYTIPAAGVYHVFCRSYIQPNSALSIVISQNGSTMYTSAAPNPTQEYVVALIELNCAVGDVILVTLSSSNVSDSLPEAVKSTITVAQVYN